MTTTLTLKYMTESIPVRVRGIIGAAFASAESAVDRNDAERLTVAAEDLRAKLPAAFDVFTGPRFVSVRRLPAKLGKTPSPVATIERAKTEAEREAERANVRALVRKELETMVARGAEAVKKVADAATVPGEFARQVSWGHAIEEDLLAAYAAEALATLDDPKFLKPIEDVLRYYLGELTRRALRVSDRPTSTNPFSNAVTIEKMDVDRKFREFCERYLEWIERRA